MELGGLEKFVCFWNEVFSSNDPIAEKDRLDGRMSDRLSKWFEYEIPVYPEPYYGYFSEDMSKDPLLLLINPGKLDLDKEGLVRLNSFTKNRIVNWRKEDYIEDEKELKKINELAVKWRRTMKQSIERCVGPIDFFHTVEFFPYHSTNWINLNSNEKSWYYDTKSNKLLVEAIIDIVKNKKVKYVLGKSILWDEILVNSGFEKTGEVVIKKEETGGTAHRIFKYQLKGETDSIPVVIHISGGGGMFFPKDTEAVKHIREFLNI